MAFDAHKNLAITAVATAPSPPTSGLSLVVTAGEAARFPAPPFNATVWPASAIPTPVNAEVVRVTAITTNTLTIVRAQEGSVARAITVGDLIAATVTAKTITDLEAQAPITGTWTPVLAGDGATSGQVYTTQTGIYVKVGRSVFAYAYINLQVKGTTSGLLQIQGLPIAATAEIPAQSIGSSSQWIFAPPGFYAVGGVVGAGGTVVYLRGVTAQGDLNTNLTTAALKDGSQISMPIFYLAA